MNQLRVVIFCRLPLWDWRNSDAPFLAGVASELAARGHEVQVIEPYQKSDLEVLLAGAQLVLVQSGCHAELVRRVGEHRRQCAHYQLLYHDNSPGPVGALGHGAELRNYDGALAAGSSLAAQYVQKGLARRTWTWHAAADVRVFMPQPQADAQGDLVWSGEWDGHFRGDELREFLLRPIAELGLEACIYGQAPSRAAQSEVERAGASYHRCIANFLLPALFSRFRATVHLPQRMQSQALPGIPAGGMFEAMACGLPLVSALWHDQDGLFTAGSDYLFAEDGAAMVRQLKRVLEDADLADELAVNGRQTILARHTCAHRVNELLDIYRLLSLGRESGTVGAWV